MKGMLKRFLGGFTEVESKEELMAIIADVATLGNDFPELAIASETGRMLVENYFDINRRPWDFLVLTGYVLHELFVEADDDEIFFDLFNRAEDVFRKPLPWMCNAVTDEVRQRYCKANGRSLPDAALYRKKLPRYLRGCKMVALHSYAQLRYVLSTFGYNSFVPDYALNFYLLLDMRNLLRSMECPPQEAIDKISEEMAMVQLPKITKALKRVEYLSDAFALSNCSLVKDAEELETLREIARGLGYGVEFTKLEDSAEEESGEKADETLADNEILETA